MESSTVWPSGAVSQTPSFSALNLKLACITPCTLSLSHQTNACAPGVSVVNIDNGYGGAMVAAKMLLRATRMAKK